MRQSKWIEYLLVFVEGICRLAEWGDRILLVSKVLKPYRKLASRVFETQVRWQNRASETWVLVLRWRNLSTWNSSFLDSRSIWRTEKTYLKEEKDTIWKIRSKKCKFKKDKQKFGVENAKRSELENVDLKNETDLNKGVDLKNATDTTT